MSATSAPQAEFQDAGKPVAFPLYLVDVNGNPISSTNALPISVSLAATSVAIEDGTTSSQKLAVDGSGKIGINALPTVTETNSSSINSHLANIDTDSAALVTNTTGLATQTTLAAAKTDLDTIVTNTTGVATAANQTTGNTNTSAISTTTGATADAAVTGDNAGTLSAKLRGLTKILADIWDSTNHLFASNVKQIGGQSPTLDNTTVLATSMRVKTTVAGDTALAVGQATMANSLPVTVASNQTPLTSGTGTKSNVASSASSVTILASNANRKGAIIYNDSTQVLYLDLSGGTATNASYSVQIPSNGYFELPPQPIYTGAITGIWASANGNARVTEFS